MKPIDVTRISQGCVTLSVPGVVCSPSGLSSFPGPSPGGGLTEFLGARGGQKLPDCPHPRAMRGSSSHFREGAGLSCALPNIEHPWAAAQVLGASP